MSYIPNIGLEVFDPGSDVHRVWADKLEEWSAPEQMLRLSYDALMHHTKGWFAVNHDNGELVGYRAVTEDYGDSQYEIGGLILNPSYRGKGLGRKIAETVLAVASNDFPLSRFIVFANSLSLAINKGLGFRESSIDDVPEDAVRLCKSCPKYPRDGLGCCDTILVIDTPATTQVPRSLQ